MANSQHPHAVVEFVDTSEKVLDSVGGANSVLHAISASEAFTKYNWLAGAPILNSAGDFRGMVVSADWRTVFQMTSKVDDVVGNLSTLAGLASNIWQAKSTVESILNSNDSWDVKGAKLSTQVTSISVRTIAGGIPAGFGILAYSLQGYCQLGGLATGGRFQPQACISNLKAANTYVNTSFNTITDGNNIYAFINATVTPVVDRLFGY